MEKRTYIHYGNNRYDDSRFRDIKNIRFFVKPDGGLWASPVDSDGGWKDWCYSTDFRDCEDSNSFKFTLSDGAKVLSLLSVSDLDGLPRQAESMGITDILDFEQLVRDGYDAIEFSLFNNDGLYWALYGWDCDCILILNKLVIVPTESA